MKTLAGVLLVAAFTGALNFVVTYLIGTGFPRSEVGRNAFIFAACEAAVLGLSVLSMVFGRFWGSDALGLLAFAGFTGVSWWRWTVLIRAQSSAREFGPGGEP